jgi:radical SAM superfamily enzyme with C-terminal helix-hairpin-helix motif
VELEGRISYGRQMGSYPVLAGIPLPMAAGTILDAVVVDWGMRSVTALPCPVDVNRLPVQTLAWIPGIGKKRARALAAARPIRDLAAFRQVAGATPLERLFSFRVP